MNTHTLPEENLIAKQKLRRIARENGVDATMDKYSLDAIATLMDSPLASVAAATGMLHEPNFSALHML